MSAEPITAEEIEKLLQQAWQLGRTSALEDITAALHGDERAGLKVDYQRVLAALKGADQRTYTSTWQEESHGSG